MSELDPRVARLVDEMRKELVTRRPWAGADWVRAQKREMSPLGEGVADLLGVLYQGIYHLDSPAFRKVDWSNPLWVAVPVQDGYMSTWDFRTLTDLVVLCHERCLRCHVQGLAPHYLRLLFHPRQRTGTVSERHPTIEDAVARVRRMAEGEVD